MHRLDHVDHVSTVPRCAMTDDVVTMVRLLAPAPGGESQSLKSLVSTDPECEPR